jgi:hypothetical protein
MISRLPKLKTYQMDLFRITGNILGAMEEKQIELEETGLYSSPDYYLNDYQLFQSSKPTQKLQKLYFSRQAGKIDFKNFNIFINISSSLAFSHSVDLKIDDYFGGTMNLILQTLTSLEELDCKPCKIYTGQQ